jgi:hypothetical protein
MKRSVGLIGLRLVNHGPGDPSFCIQCGQRLESAHRFCPGCGSPRWSPPPQSEPGLPPVPAAPPPAAVPAQPPRALPWIFAAGAILALVSAAQAAAVLASGAGRAQLAQQLASGGMSPVNDRLVVAFAGGQLLFYVLAAGLHALAYYGLRSRRRWGWLAALLLAGLWSLVLIGIPLLYVLLRPSTRRAYGID